MNLKRSGILLTICCLVACVVPACGEPTPGAGKDKLPLLSYGSGKTIVRVYTDYFCPPCRSTESELEPLLVDLVKSNKITLVFVDAPIYKDSQVYAKHFLYALKKKNDFEYALRVRSALFEAATGKVNKDALEGFLKDKGITLVPFDAAPVLTRLNALLREDNVTSTPTCLIVKDGKSEKKVGGKEVLKALKELQ
ncbi:DsbA family protein [Syntrophorhabdus aromaticivorans]|uniref:Thioredoxin domain-containing protein n=1 Tax=Syntrophorhabdus aromaticivorans TaxID=328301 RepID=A0A971M3R6_9BACT|nr:thioredoxin domain-containing protein [Syntrophorhabdus aromaticivorans]NLW34749.1 thioredoxin domain-containing protein [Syntrophorhabdus aromaticivorans]